MEEKMFLARNLFQFFYIYLFIVIYSLTFFFPFLTQKSHVKLIRYKIKWGYQSFGECIFSLTVMVLCWYFRSDLFESNSLGVFGTIVYRFKRFCCKYISGQYPFWEKLSIFSSLLKNTTSSSETYYQAQNTEVWLFFA